MDKLSFMAGDLIVSILKEFTTLSPIPQLHCNASYCKKIKREDGLIDFTNTAEEVYRKFRAFYGWPGVFFRNGLKLLEIDFLKGDGKQGEIISIDGESVVVAFAEDAIKIDKLQPKGKKPMSAKAFLVGRGLKVGDKIF